MALPIIWGASSLYVNSPVLMVQIGGVMTGVFLLGVLAAAWYLRARETDRRLYAGPVFNGALLLSTVAIAFLGIYTVASTLGVKVG